MGLVFFFLFFKDGPFKTNEFLKVEIFFCRFWNIAISDVIVWQELFYLFIKFKYPAFPLKTLKEAYVYFSYNVNNTKK